jgi:hypothetical protein
MERHRSFGFGHLAICALITASLGAASARTAIAHEHGAARSSRHSDSVDYERAAQALPQFCREWHSKLEQRVEDRGEVMEWQDRSGWKTATYQDYGPIESCTCKLQHGVPVAEITYKTIEYYLAGHTVDEARHARPIVAGSTNTIVILRWKDGRWIYE